MVCFYIISYASITYITTVYRSYGANTKAVVILVHVAIRVRVEHVVGTSINHSAFIIDSSRPEVSIVRVRIDSRRRKPLPSTMPYLLQNRTNLFVNKTKIMYHFYLICFYCFYLMYFSSQ